jgi:hypothetical protein
VVDIFIAQKVECAERASEAALRKSCAASGAGARDAGTRNLGVRDGRAPTACCDAQSLLCRRSGSKNQIEMRFFGCDNAALDLPHPADA